MVLASVYIGGQTLRLSSPRVENLERIEELLFPRLEADAGSIRREASPLPLPFLDADVWIFRMPPGLDPDRRTSSRASRWSTTSRTSGSTGRGTVWMVDRRWRPRSRPIAVTRSHGPS